MKKKFVNLKRLCLSGDTQPWGPLPNSAISTFVAFIFSVPEFEVNVDHHRIGLDNVQMFFQQCIKYIETKKLIIDFGNCYMRDGFTFRNSKTSHDNYEIPNIPHMIIRINQQLIFREPDLTPQAVVKEFEDILQCVGYHLHILELRRDEAVGRGSLDANLVDMVLNTCPNLRDLRIDHHGYLDCCDMEKVPHTGMQTIRFGLRNTYENGFSKALSARLPNLKHMVLPIGMESNYFNFDDINMPNTRFTELDLDILDYRKVLKDHNHSRETEVAIRITTKDDNSDCYYYCCIFLGRFIHKLELIHKQNYSNNNNGEYIVQKTPDRESYVTIHIVCLSMETFRLGSSRLSMQCAVRL